MKRILVTGSRDWGDSLRFSHALYWATLGSVDDVVVIHGANDDDERSLDLIAERLAKQLGMPTEPHPADWPTCAPECNPKHRKVNRRGQEYCPSAGHRRNAEMVALGADICLAFIRNGSKGATGCADLAEKAGIPVRRFTEESR